VVFSYTQQTHISLCVVTFLIAILMSSIAFSSYLVSLRSCLFTVRLFQAVMGPNLAGFSKPVVIVRLRALTCGDFVVAL
jgi:hypothetical protein